MAFGYRETSNLDLLKVELERLRLKQLLERGRVEGVDEQSVEDALDSDNPKETLIRSMVEHIRKTGAATDEKRVAMDLADLRAGVDAGDLVVDSHAKDGSGLPREASDAR